VGSFSYIDSDMNEASIAGSPDDPRDSSGPSECDVSVATGVSEDSSSGKSSSLLSNSVTVA
jgi:hypothetical protein